MGRGSIPGENSLLIQFAREPVVGAVKTRLIPALGPVGACQLHEALVWQTCRNLLAVEGAEVQLWVAGDTAHPLFGRCREAGASGLHRQRGSDLGERMADALRRGLQQASRVLLVGSDCPGLDPDYLGSALAALARTPVVLGPAVDGGYVLVGARQPVDALFRNVRWGSGEVLAVSQANARAAGWEVTLLDERADVDRPADLVHCADLLAQRQWAEWGSSG